VGKSEENGIRKPSPLHRRFQVPPAFNVSSPSLVAFPVCLGIEVSGILEMKTMAADGRAAAMYDDVVACSRA
jgi:hypothetical protein